MSVFRKVHAVFSLSLLFIVVAQVSAQVGAATCPILVEQALEELDNNCDSLDRNSACYGYNRVDSTFTTDVPVDFFSQPADRTELTTLQTIQTAPLNLDENVWGIAVMNVQANVPNTLPGQAVTFIVMGDALVENRVDAESAVLPADPIEIVVESTTDLRSGPGLNHNTVATAAPGQVLETDALSSDSAWLRIGVANRVAWVSRDAVTAPAAVNDLPIITANTRSPMQAFYFSTGFGAPVCNEAPDVVTVHSRENVTVNLSVNGVDIAVGSTVSFKNISATQIIIIVHEGSIDLPDGRIVEEGDTIIVTIDDEGNIVALGEIRPSDEVEQGIGETAQAALDVVTLELVEETDEIIHIVAAGETLNSIAQLYDTSAQGILTRNDLPGPGSIVAGMLLVIPNPGGGFVAYQPPAPPPVTTGGTTGTTVITTPLVDCTGFRPTSPTDYGLVLGTNIFYWDPPRSPVDKYVVTVYSGGAPYATFEAFAPNTTVTGVILGSTIAPPRSFNWDVKAVLNGQDVCISSRTNIYPVP